GGQAARPVGHAVGRGRGPLPGDHDHAGQRGLHCAVRRIRQALGRAGRQKPAVRRGGFPGRARARGPVPDRTPAYPALIPAIHARRTRIANGAKVSIFEALESRVRSYSRSWPVVFDKATGSWLYDESGTPYLDFFAGAGALNYGHNHPDLKRVLLDYISSDRVTHSLDMYTAAKRRFLEAFDEIVLRPRELEYKVIFPGPGGANAVEAALKLARKVTGRESVINFTNAFHGMTLGALSVTGHSMKRGGAGVALGHAHHMACAHSL